jgi:EAL domain-containing protein (putative c-di-GMP-specific phosphodiesterase class I)
MYEAKKRGRNNYIYFHPDMMQSPTQFLTRESELYQALQHNQFVLYYQPQYSFLENRITSVEALIRWQHPSKGMLSPAEIIPVAESSSLIVDIGNWVLSEACRQLDEWRANGLSDMRVAVNISIRQLASNQLPSLISSLLRQYMLPSHLLELEITESCLQNDATNIACLKDLEKLGVSISIDDFGTGYSCMSSLKYLPIRRLKIDQSFVRDIPDDQNDCAISSAILALGRQLNMQVIAEGVETVEQVKFLSALGCDELQGYYLSRPVAPQEIPELTKKIPIHIKSLIYI